MDRNATRCRRSRGTGSGLATVLLAACVASPGAPQPAGAPASAGPETAHQDSLEARPERFFDWTDLDFSPQVYAERRAGLVRLLLESGGGVFLAPASDGFSSGETFRQRDDFLYFTGLELPNSVLAIDADRREATVFAPPTDARFENASRTNDFPGRPLAEDPEIARRSGIERVRPLEELHGTVDAWVAEGQTVWLNLGRRGTVEPRESAFVQSWSPEQALALHLRRVFPGLALGQAFGSVARLRMVKGPEEVEKIRRACAITCEGIRDAAAHIREGVDERTLEAELEAGWKRRGAQRRAFDSIVKSGPNSLWPWRILAAQYDRRNRVLRDGELVIFDVGCELDHYASDVGRTFPVSGRFSEAQARRLRMVTRVTDAVIAAARSGVTLAELQSVARASIPESERPYMQTGLFFGHHIGLDVGDPSLPDVVLEPGMVFTVEPWYYNHDEGLAVFLEDNIVITADGAENLTGWFARTPEELESLLHD